MTRDRQWLGREGEARAARFLETRGYRIVARNVRADHVEIDLIARRGDLLVFVEVKSRRMSGLSSGHGTSGHGPSGHGRAAEAVDERKQRRLRRGARAWLAANPIQARRSRSRRFDVVTCLLDADPTIAEVRSRNESTALEAARWSIEHWEAAF